MYENMFKCLSVKGYSGKVLYMTLLILFDQKSNVDETPAKLRDLSF